MLNLTKHLKKIELDQEFKSNGDDPKRVLNVINNILKKMPESDKTKVYYITYVLKYGIEKFLERMDVIKNFEQNEMIREK